GLHMLVGRDKVRIVKLDEIKSRHAPIHQESARGQNEENQKRRITRWSRGNWNTFGHGFGAGQVGGTLVNVTQEFQRKYPPQKKKPEHQVPAFWKDLAAT